MRKIILIIIFSLILVTGCYSDKKENAEVKEEIIEGLNTIIEFNSSEDEKLTKIKLNISNNTKKEYELKTVKFLITDINDKVNILEKAVNYTIKIDEEYSVEVDSDIEYKNIKIINYNI